MEFALFFFVGLSVGLFAGYFFNREREKDLLDRLTPDYLMMRNFSESNRQASKKWSWPDLGFIKKKVVDIPVAKQKTEDENKEDISRREEFMQTLKQLHEQGVPQA